MDTVTLIRSAIRGLLRVADAELQTELRALVRRDDDYASAGKPVCDYDDPTAREALVDALARDAMALVRALDGRELAAEVDQAARLLATVVGQDLDHGTDGVFRIARRVAADRVISTVDPQARHGHKTSARGFDGYKGHIAIDPDTEIVTATTVTAANAGDAEPAEVLLADDLPERAPGDDDRNDQDAARRRRRRRGTATPAVDADAESVAAHQLAVYGDAAYGAGQAAGHPGHCGRADHDQGAAAARAGRTVRQGPLHHRPGRRHRHLPRARECGHPTGHDRRRGGRVRDRLRRLPASRPVHHLARRPHRDHRRPRGTPGPRPRRAGRPRVAGRLHRHPARRWNARSGT